MSNLRHALFCICGWINGGNLPMLKCGKVPCPNCRRDLVTQLNISEFGGG